MKNLRVVVNNEGLGIQDENGMILPYEWDMIELRPSVFKVGKKSGKSPDNASMSYGAFSESGKQILPPKYYRITLSPEDGEELAIIANDGNKDTLYDGNGNVLIPAKDGIVFLGTDLVIVTDNGKDTIRTYHDEQVLPEVRDGEDSPAGFDSTFALECGLLHVSNDGTEGLWFYEDRYWVYPLGIWRQIIIEQTDYRSCTYRLKSDSEEIPGYIY